MIKYSSTVLAAVAFSFAAGVAAAVFYMNHIEEEEAEYQGSSEEESSVQEVVTEENAVANDSDGEFSVISHDSEESSNDDSEDMSEDEFWLIKELEKGERPNRMWIDSVSINRLFFRISSLEQWTDSTQLDASFDFPDVFVEPERFTELSKVLATLVGLHTLRFEYHYPSGMHSVVTNIVQHTRQIRRLDLTWVPRLESGENPDIALHAQHLADALRHHPALEEIILCNLSPDETRLLTAVFPTMSRLQRIRLEASEHTMPVHPETLSHVLQVTSLREVWFDHCNISDLIAEGLSFSPLKKLTFFGCEFPNEVGSALAAALKCNTELEDLRFNRCSPDSTFCSALKESLSTNTTLTELAFPGIELPEQAIVDLVAAARSNYGLEKIEVSVRDTNQESLLRCIPCLNKAGRRYLSEDATSKERGVKVLEKVKNDLDCLFLHLQENPLLCVQH